MIIVVGGIFAAMGMIVIGVTSVAIRFVAIFLPLRRPWLGRTLRMVFSNCLTDPTKSSVSHQIRSSIDQTHRDNYARDGDLPYMILGDNNETFAFHAIILDSVEVRWKCISQDLCHSKKYHSKPVIMELVCDESI